MQPKHKNLRKWHMFLLINGHALILSSGLSFIGIPGQNGYLLCARGRKAWLMQHVRVSSLPAYPLSSCSDIAFQTIDLAWIIAGPLCWLWLGGRNGQGVKVGQPFGVSVGCVCTVRADWTEHQHALNGDNNQSKTRIGSDQRKTTNLVVPDCKKGNFILTNRLF